MAYAIVEEGVEQVAEQAKTASAKKKRGRRPGHPRSTGENSDNPRADIVSAARKLFGQNGYGKTSMTAIAREAGLDQSSLYYWFKSKEHLLDEILVESFNTCEHKGKLFHAAAPCGVRLYSLLFRRTFKYCNLPVDVLAVEEASDKGGNRFEQFFTNLESYKLNLQTLVNEGMHSGDFITGDEWQMTAALMSIVMSSQHSYHRSRVGKFDMVGSALELDGLESPADWAHHSARSGLIMLLAQPDKVGEYAAEADAHGWLRP